MFTTIPARLADRASKPLSVFELRHRDLKIMRVCDGVHFYLEISYPSDSPGVNVQKTELFFKNLNIALSTSAKFFLKDVPVISFQDYSDKNSTQINELIDSWFKAMIKDRDMKGISRESTVYDCSGMAVSLYLFLQDTLGIPCHIVIGDMKIFGELEYNTSYEHLYEIINGKPHDKINYHVWVITENYLIIDPTFRLKESEKELFISGKTDAGVCIYNIKKIPDELDYIPMLVGLDLLIRTNQLSPIEFT